MCVGLKSIQVHFCCKRPCTKVTMFYATTDTDCTFLLKCCGLRTAEDVQWKIT